MEHGHYTPLAQLMCCCVAALHLQAAMLPFTRTRRKCSQWHALRVSRRFHVSTSRVTTSRTNAMPPTAAFANLYPPWPVHSLQQRPPVTHIEQIA